MRTKSIIAAAMLVSFAGVGYVSAAIPPGCEDFSGDVTVVIPIASAFAGAPLGDFNPDCVIVSSGATITWENQDGVPHDPGDTLDGGTCFKTDRDGRGDLNPLEKWSIRVANSANVFNVEEEAGTRLITDSSDPVFETNQEACPNASDAEESVDGEYLVVPYRCWIHGSMQGTIVVLF